MFLNLSNDHFMSYEEKKKKTIINNPEEKNKK